MRTAPVAHFAGELIAVRVVVAIDTTLRSQLQIVSRPLCPMANGARCGLVPPEEGELGSAVLLDGELRRPEPVLVVAGRAVCLSKRPAMHVSMAVGALLELQATISPLRGKLGRVALVTCNTLMQTFERKDGERMSAEPDLLRQPGPADARMATLTSIAELGFMHRRMAGDAVRAHAWWRDVAFIVASLALRFGVARREAQARMIGSDVGNFRPVALVVAGGAFGARKRPFVRVFVAGDAVRLQSEEGRGATSIAAIVAILAGHRNVSPLERPTRLAMVESLLSASGPAHELRVSSQMLDMTSAARLLLILPRGVQAQAPTDPNAELVVTTKTRVGIEAFAARVALAAVLVAFDLGMGAGQLSRREKLGAGPLRHERSADGGGDHHASQDDRGGDSPRHEEKIQR